jgi:hypothetical protein
VNDGIRRISAPGLLAHSIGRFARDIPFFQSAKFEFSINFKTAKALGLTVPTALLAA